MLISEPFSANRDSMNSFRHGLIGGKLNPEFMTIGLSLSLDMEFWTAKKIARAGMGAHHEFGYFLANPGVGCKSTSFEVKEITENQDRDATWE